MSYTERAERRGAGVSRGVARAMLESDRRTNQQVLGAVLLAIGGNWLLAEFGLFTFGWPGLFAVALMTLGMAMVGTAKAGLTKPLIALGIVLTVGLAMSSGISSPVRGQAFGDRLYVPETVNDLRERYSVTVGDLTLDLRELDLDEARREVEATVRVGELHVLVPEGLPLRVRADIGGPGEIDLFGQSSDGVGDPLSFQSDDFEDAASRLDLDLSISAVGEITVERA
ncbi:MAG TPA: LiaF domain-containing protein [Acidimicrobiales bacterium]|nr:LiaF domain-containing protein [Acidimicrobiales bacterium]